MSLDNDREFYLDVEFGKIVQMRVARFHFDKMKLTDGCYKVKITKGKRRSNKQNAYYWGVVIPFVFEGLRDAGFETVTNNDDAHLVCKSLFLKEKEEHKYKGSVIKIEKAGSSKKLTTKEFEDYITNITVWAFDYLNVVIPAPGQQLDMDYEEVRKLDS